MVRKAVSYLVGKERKGENISKKQKQLKIFQIRKSSSAGPLPGAGAVWCLWTTYTSYWTVLPSSTDFMTRELTKVLDVIYFRL